MYYKEAWINGKLCYKSTPDGKWIPFTIGQYKQRVLELEKKVKNLDLPQVINAVCIVEKNYETCSMHKVSKYGCFECKYNKQTDL